VIADERSARTQVSAGDQTDVRLCPKCRLRGRLDSRNRRDKTIPATRDRLDVLRSSRIVAKCLTKLGNGLSEGVIGDVRAGPQRIEQLFFRHQRTRVIEQMQQEVEELGCQFHDGVVSHNVIASAIDEEAAEFEVGTCHGL